MEENSQSSKTEAEASKTEKRPRGFVSDIILNAVEPGVNYSVLLFLNLVFVFLFATLVVFTFLTDFNIHLIFLSLLTLGLMVGLNIFINQLPSGGEGTQTETETERTHEETEITTAEKRIKKD